ncbi:MAG: dihydroorotase [Deltaproteobacteria bacterium]|nr:dihydroorotase [Deltaproteobacteria bacterium]
MNKFLIKGGRVIDPANGVDGIGDVLIEGEKIKEIRIEGQRVKVSKGQRVKDSDTGLRTIDASGLLVCPGFIDMHTHLREPGYEYKETIRTGTMAAAAGGFTSIACMANTNPVNDNTSVTRYILKKAMEEGVINVLPIGAISKGLKGETLAEIGELKDSGCVAISDDGRPVANSGLMRLAMEYAKQFNLLVISHCEDTGLAGDGVMNEGFVSTKLGLKGIPDAAEDIMAARDIALAELTEGRLHIAHISTKGSVALVRNAKQRGLNITAEVTPHHFTLTDEAVIGYNTNTKMNPPLRTMQDIDAIKRGLEDGTIDAIATDHAPQTLDEKDVEFDKAANGIIGLETALPLCLRLVSDNVLTLSELIAKLSANPAKLFGLDSKGQLKVGADADIAIVDLNKEWIVDAKELKSKSRNTPFDGWKMKGKAVKTIVAGRVVYER